MPQALKKAEKQHYTYNDYKDWDLKAGERYEIIYGEAFAMAAPSDRHQAVLGELHRQLANFLQGKPCKVRLAPYDVRLDWREDGKDSTVVQPDLSIICDEEKLGEEGCRGAPKIVIEISSPSSRSYDAVKKFNLYKDAGVAEYWLVDPEVGYIWLCDFQGEKAVTLPFDTDDTLKSAALPGLEIKLSEVFV
jgi:Uma2 family endonuclease